MEGKCPLGRPWNALHRSIFLETYLDGSVLPAGYIKWSDTDARFDNTTFMAVYSDDGPGYDEADIATSNISIVLDAEGLAPYSGPSQVFLGPDGEANNVGWIDTSVYKG
jgi:hypothetical protein